MIIKKETNLFSEEDKDLFRYDSLIKQSQIPNFEKKYSFDSDKMKNSILKFIDDDIEEENKTADDFK